MSSTESVKEAPPGPRTAHGVGAAALIAQLALFTITFLPLIVPVPANFNIVATASLCVLVGSLRSVKGTPPAESMTRKASPSSGYFALA